MIVTRAILALLLSAHTRALQVQGGDNDKGLTIEKSWDAAKPTALVYDETGAKGDFVFEEFEGGHKSRGFPGLALP